MMMVIKEPRWFSVTEVAEIIGISRTAVLKKIQRGQIHAKKVGRSYIISASDLPGVHRPISSREKKKVEGAVDRTLREYGEVIKKLGET